MKTNSANSAPNLGATSRVGRARLRSESEYLQQQAVNARAAMRQAFDEMEAKLRGDARSWTNLHPLLTVGAAAAGGFLASRLLIAPRARRVQRVTVKSFGHDGHGEGAMPSVFASLLKEPVIEAVRAALEDLVATAVSSLSEPTGASEIEEEQAPPDSETDPLAPDEDDSSAGKS